MNTLCFVLVLFTTQIIYTKEESSLDQNKTASTSTTSSSKPPPKDLNHGIDFGKVELFKDEDRLPSSKPSESQDLTPGSNQSEPLINSTKPDLSKNGPTAIAKGNQTSEKIYEDYDINDLQLDKYKIMVGPNKYKKINATNVRFLNRNPSLVNNSGDTRFGIHQFEIKLSGQYLILPNGTRISGYKSANNLTNPGSVPEPTPSTNSNNSATPIPWVISPACLQKNDSKYLFSAIFDKKPTVHLLTADNGTIPTNQTPNIVINDNSVTLSVGKASPRNESYVKLNTSNPAVVTTDNKTTPVNNGKLKIEDKALKGLTQFTTTIQNNTKPQNQVTLSKVTDSLTISEKLQTHGDDKKPIPLLDHNKIVPNTTVQQIQQQTVHLLTAPNRTTPTNQTPNTVINNNTVTLSGGNLRNESYVNLNPSSTSQSEALTKSSNSVVMTTVNSTSPVNNGKLKIEDSLLKGLTQFTMTIQNNTKPQNQVTLSKVGDSLTVSELKAHGNDIKSIPLLDQIIQHKIVPNTTAQQIQQQTVHLIPHLHANVSVKTPTLTITAQGTKKIDQLPLFLLDNNLLQTPIPGVTLNKTQTTIYTKPQQTINNILNSELSERSFFPPELDENFKRPTEKKTVGDLITQKETDVQQSDVLYELFKNITMTNVINEDLNRQLLNESQIHTQQNWQMIKDNTNILNALKDKNQQNASPQMK